MRGSLGRALSRLRWLLVRTRDVLAEEGPTGVARRVLRGTSSDYRLWIGLYDQVTDDDVRRMRVLSEQFGNRPLISIVMPTYETPEEYLRAAIDSVLAQTYDNWQLCIADDASRDPRMRATLEEYAAREPRIRFVFRTENGHISKASNSALDLAGGEWVAFLDHDDVLAPHALFSLVAAINENPDARIVYSDEDKIDDRGARSGHYFKPDWNPELFRSHNLMTHLTAFRRALVEDAGRLREGFEGAQDYDLALRCVERVEPQQIVHVPLVLYHWRRAAGSTALSSSAKPYAMLAGERALQEHLDRSGINGRAELIDFGYRIHYALPATLPQVSLVILTRNQKRLLKACIDSIVGRSTYPRFEIIVVDNGSDEPETRRYLGELEASKRARVLHDPQPFNYSALNNAGVALAAGEIVVLLNDDIEVITPGWLEELVGLALQPGVGAVGPMLLYPNGTIQHAGVVLGIGGMAAHGHEHLRPSGRGYNGRTALVSNYTSLTGACLAVRKDRYESVGGLEEALPVAYNDLDFCLKLKAMGLRNVWTPFAQLHHLASATRGPEDSPEKLARQNSEKDFMRDKWGAIIARDPAYSPNLTIERADFTLAFPPRVTRPW